MASEKPHDRTGYSEELTSAVVEACLTVFATIGSNSDDLCVVGGLVPRLLELDGHLDRPSEVAGNGHPGTLDLDVGFRHEILEEQRYAALSQRLRHRRFGPERNEQGNLVVQTWKQDGSAVTLDLLVEPLPDGPRAGGIQNLEPDLGAIVTPGLSLAFADRTWVSVEGWSGGQALRRDVPVCGPAAYIVLKALAHHDRTQEKDAFDLVYVLARATIGIDAIGDRLAELAPVEPGVVERALRCLADDFPSPDSVGVDRFLVFDDVSDDGADAIRADVHGLVDDLLRSCRRHGLLGPGPDRPDPGSVVGP